MRAAVFQALPRNSREAVAVELTSAADSAPHGSRRRPRAVMALEALCASAGLQ
jgi:hypothetical protein